MVQSREAVIACVSQPLRVNIMHSFIFVSGWLALVVLPCVFRPTQVGWWEGWCVLWCSAVWMYVRVDLLW